MARSRDRSCFPVIKSAVDVTATLSRGRQPCFFVVAGAHEPAVPAPINNDERQDEVDRDSFPEGDDWVIVDDIVAYG